MVLRFGGLKSYTCINAIQNRALRFYLGTGKYTPTAAVTGDMGWHPAFVKQWKRVCYHYRRHLTMNSSRLNERIFIWSYRKSNRCSYNVRKVLKRLVLLRNMSIFQTQCPRISLSLM